MRGGKGRNILPRVLIFFYACFCVCALLISIPFPETPIEVVWLREKVCKTRRSTREKHQNGYHRNKH